MREEWLSFFTKKNDYKVHSHIQDTNGNYLILDMTVFNKRLSLINIQEPNKDDPSFNVNLFETISEIGNKRYVIRGDFSYYT